ncbi:MAG: tripartite tricarboxylate transporter substrate binding protein [Betaproteobacteria bacterium]|nr:tripartite tricarboxylate transporter substrate binding protein [Betaproteobacteria bacterium]MBI3052448.1 tripartite tricarboxylate transporter substrate binding protein [Betaproteobacteria bacterium]
MIAFTVNNITRNAFVLLLLAVSLPFAQAQNGKWPNKPVRMVVPFPPGGATDVVARLMALHLSEEFGQQFIVDNRPGAGSAIGNEIVVRANSDGYTILLGNSSYTSNAALYKLPYDPVNGISPVALITDGPLIFAVHPSVKAAGLKEFIELARAKPNALNFATSGTGSLQHLGTELLMQMLRTHMVHVPYKGGAPAIIDLVAGRVHFYLSGPLEILPHVKAGKVRAIAVTSAQRWSLMPELPAVSEQVPGYTATPWYAMFAPAGTSRAIIAQLNEAIARILKKPAVDERLRAYGMEPAHNTPEQFSRFIAGDLAKWVNVVKAANIKVD